MIFDLKYFPIKTVNFILLFKNSVVRDNLLNDVILSI
jgi:hypothetical protein